MEPQEAAYEDRVPLETPNIFCLWPHRHRGCALGSLWLRQSSPPERLRLVTSQKIIGKPKRPHSHPSFRDKSLPSKHRAMGTHDAYSIVLAAVGYAVVRVLPMTCRNSAALRVRQSSGRVALNLMVWTLRSRTAESYANAGVRPVAITTPEHSCVGIGYRHGGRHLLSLRFPP